jgi:hypothetical protein
MIAAQSLPYSHCLDHHQYSRHLKAASSNPVKSLQELNDWEKSNWENLKAALSPRHNFHNSKFKIVFYANKLFKTAFRNLTKRKGYSLLNICGTCHCVLPASVLIFQYVAYERAMIVSSEKADQIVRPRGWHSYQQGKLAWKSATSYPAFGPTMK